MSSPDNPGASFVATGDGGYPVCNLCEAICDGNGSCWACVDRWDWARGLPWHTLLVAELRTRTPGKPCGADEIAAFMKRIDEAPLRSPWFLEEVAGPWLEDVDPGDEDPSSRVVHHFAYVSGIRIADVVLVHHVEI